MTLRAEVASCQVCNGIVLGAGLDPRTSPPAGEYLWPADVWPDHSPTDLEEEIRKSYDEARMILSLSPAAAAVLARRCLQHVIRKRLQIKKGTLFAEIADAMKREELSKPTRDSLQHIRQIGNWGAHPSQDEAGTLIEVTDEEAKYTIEALEMVFDDLYVTTARAKAMKARIEDRKTNAVSTA